VKIKKIDLRQIEIPYVEPFQVSKATEITKKTNIVKVETEDGYVGWGETDSFASPWYNYETVEGNWYILKEFMIPSLLEKEFSMETLYSQLNWIQGNLMAYDAIAEAIADISAQQKNLSLAQYLGGSLTRTKSGISLGIQKSTDYLLKKIQAANDKGYQRIKLKIKPGKDLDVLEKVRREFPDIGLMVDANSAYSLTDEHIKIFKEMDRHHLMMIEQPFLDYDFVNSAALQKQISTPVCLDESIHTLGDCQVSNALGSCQIINIKVSRVGGPLKAKTIHDFCMEHNIPVWCGGMRECGIGRAVNLAVSSLPNFTIPGDISGTDIYFEEDITEEQFVLNKDGTMDIPQGKGIGVHVLEDRLEKYSLRHKSFFTLEQ